MLQPVVEFAPAKLNIYLHITGKRADGYHLLDSLVAFTQFGDRLECYPDDILSLDIEGSFADVLHPAPDNLVLKAANALKQQTQCRQGARIVLHKEIPVGAGLGGGSSDAAAALRGLVKLWNVSVTPNVLHGIAAAIGSDVPACLYQKPAVLRDVGTQVVPATLRARAAILLLNPLIPVPTAEVYRRFKGDFDATYDASEIPDVAALCRVMGTTHNTLEAAAVSLCPAIADGLSAIKASPGCKAARMSGSGGTCFGVFENSAEAKNAQRHLEKQLPEWWMVVTELA